MLITNYITSAWRNILRHKLFSIINILGLAIGLASCILITLFIRDELSYDKFWANSAQTYRINMEFNVPSMEPAKMVWSSGVTAPALAKEFSQIENIARIHRRQPKITQDGQLTVEPIFLVDPALVKIFDFVTIAGDLDNVLNNNSSIALDQTQAQQRFGDEDPLDKILTIDFGDFKKDYRVAAVFEDVPKNSQLELTSMIAINETEWEDSGLFTAWYYTGVETYYQLKKGVNNEEIVAQLPAFIDRNFPLFGTNAPNAKSSDVATITPINLEDLHLKTEGYGDLRPLGNQTIVTTFIAVAFFILLIASINFMNLSTARASQRAKEVSLRKVMGAKHRDLLIQFIGESILLTILSLIIALCFVELSLPVYNQILGKNLLINYLSPDILLITTLALLTGFIGGVYPAFILSSYRPAEVLKSNKSSENNASVRLRSALVIVQFSFSIALMVSTAVVFSQTNYANNMNLGYSKENLIVVEGLNGEEAVETALLLQNEFRRLPEVTSVSMSAFGPARTGENVTGFRTEGQPRGDATVINQAAIGYEFFKTYEIPLIAGREYDINRNDIRATEEEIRAGTKTTGTLVINESVLDTFNLGRPEEAIGKYLYQDIGEDDETFQREYEIIGVIPDVYFYSLKKVISPTAYALFPDFRNIYTIRYSGNPLTVVSQIENLWRQEVPDIPIDYQYVTDMVAAQYDEEEGQMFMFGAFSFLAIFIACLGLYGLASFTAEQRTKEIGIRKVMGAKNFDIIKLLIWQFSKPVLIANLIAWPLSYYVMSLWLEGFVYRIDNVIIIGLCALAGIFALLFAWVTVSGNSYSVAQQNPIKALRCE